MDIQHRRKTEHWDSRAPVRGDRRQYWMDHCWMEHVSYTDGTMRKRYVSEPYELGDEDLAEILALAGEWDIIIRADKAEHNPGATVAVIFERRVKAAPPGGSATEA